MKHFNSLFVASITLAIFAFVGCEQVDTNQPLPIDNAPDDNGTQTISEPQSSDTQDDSPAQNTQQDPVANETGEGGLDVQVDVGDGVDVEAGENIGVEVDESGVDVDIEPKQ